MQETCVRTGRQPRRSARAALSALGVLCVACTTQQAAPPESVPSGAAADVRVADVVLGTEVGLDKAVPRPTDVFAPEDTIYVSVVTQGTSSNTLLAARWLREG